MTVHSLYFRTTNVSRSVETLALMTQQMKMNLYCVKQGISVHEEFFTKQFQSLRCALKIRLTEAEKEQRQNEELSEILTTLQREIAEKDKELSNKHAVICELRTYIEQNKVGRVNKAILRMIDTGTKVAGFIRKTFSDKQSTSK